MLGGRIVERFVWQQNILQDVRVDCRDHRPRTSSIYLSTDVYPIAAKLALACPFHLRKFSFLGAFLRRITPWDLKPDFRSWSNANSLANIFRNRYLATLADFHLSARFASYDSCNPSAGTGRDYTA